MSRLNHKEVDVRTKDNQLICRAIKREGRLYLVFKSHKKMVYVPYDQIPELAELAFQNN